MPQIASGAVTTAKILDASVTDAKIATGISASKVGLGNVDNTTDLLKPVSTATQTALDLKANLASPTLTGTPLAPTATAGTTTTQIATTAFVTTAVTTATPDATTLVKGKVQLAGDLTGTAALPIIADGKITTAKILDASVTDAKIATGISASKVGLGNVDNTTDAAKPISTLTQAALDLKSPLASPTFTGAVTLTGGLTGTTATLSGNTTLGGTLGVTGSATLSSALNVAGNTAIGGTLGVTGNLTASGTSNTVGTITSGIWNAGVVTSSGAVTGTSIVKTGGLVSEILMADGSVLTAGTNITISSGTISAAAGGTTVREVADEFTATASQTSFTLTQTKSADSRVKMYINGIRISNTAYGVSGTTLTYTASFNGSYALVAGDRIQFDYFY